jgi:hypothetical protein
MKEFDLQEMFPASVVVSYVTEFSRNIEDCFVRLVENGHCCQRESGEHRSASDPVRARIQDVSCAAAATGSTAPKIELPRKKSMQTIKEPRLTAIEPSAQHSPRSESAILEPCRATKNASASRRHSTSTENVSAVQYANIFSSKNKFASMVTQSRLDADVQQARLNKTRQELIHKQYPAAANGTLLISGSGRNPRAPHVF